MRDNENEYNSGALNSTGERDKEKGHIGAFPGHSTSVLTHTVSQFVRLCGYKWVPRVSGKLWERGH